MHDDPGISIRQENVDFRTSDGLVLRGNRYLGPGRPKATAVLAPGFGEYAARYEALVHALATSRFAVWAVDSPGDGQRDVERAFERHVDDFGLVVERARGELPGRPFYLIGHSLGGTIVLAWTLDHQDDSDGIALLAPALRFRDRTHDSTDGWGRRVTGRVSKWPVTAHIPRLRNNNVDSEKAAVGTVASISEGGRVVLARAPELRIPILTMQGDEDEVIDPAASMEFYRAVGVRGSADNSLITWPGMKHELLNETEGEQVVGVVIGWLNGHYTEWRKANPSGIRQAAEG